MKKIEKKDWQNINENEIKNQIPKKPYATDKLENGLQILPREIALKRKYIELNTPHQKRFITFDLDYDTWPLEAEDLNLPNPLYFVQNKRNGHAHLIYALSTPVYCYGNAKTRPQQYLEAIIKAYQRRLRADPQYVGLISKNPFSKYWRVFQMSCVAYSLQYLASSLDFEELNPPKQKKQTPNDTDYSALGRNCAVFVAVKNWAYRNIKEYWTKSYSDWFSAIEFECECENAKFEMPLPLREIKSISKSVSKWTWQRFTPEKFSDLQRERVNRRWSKQSKKSIGLERLKNGASVDEVMQELNVSRATAFNWQGEIKIKPKKIIQC